MTHVSRRRIEPEVETYLLESLTLLIKDLNTKQEAEKFISSIISQTEKLMIAKRIAIAFLLRHNIEEEKICELVKVTPATVSRLKLWIQTRQESFDVLFRKLEKERKMAVAKDIFYRLLNYALNAAFGRPPKIIKFPR